MANEACPPQLAVRRGLVELPQGSTGVVAVSGGADSVALLRALMAPSDSAVCPTSTTMRNFCGSHRVVTSFEAAGFAAAGVATASFSARGFGGAAGFADLACLGSVACFGVTECLGGLSFDDVGAGWIS